MWTRYVPGTHYATLNQCHWSHFLFYSYSISSHQTSNCLSPWSHLICSWVPNLFWNISETAPAKITWSNALNDSVPFWFTSFRGIKRQCFKTLPKNPSVKVPRSIRKERQKEKNRIEWRNDWFQALILDVKCSTNAMEWKNLRDLTKWMGENLEWNFVHRHSKVHSLIYLFLSAITKINDIRSYFVILLYSKTYSKDFRSFHKF